MPGWSAALEAMPAWRDAGAETRAAVCVEIIDQINKRSHEMAHAVMHTSGQPFVMSFQAGGPHAQDRALEAVVAALVEQQRVPASVVWEKPGRDAPIRMQKDYRIVPRGVSLVIGCNTFPTWNSYPGLFASLATGNPVVVKPHPRAVLPLALTVAIARDVLAAAGFDRALVQLAPEGDLEPGGTGLAAVLALRPEVAIIDYTGGPGFGAWLETEGVAAGKLVYTEKAGLNTVVVDSTDNLKGMLGNLAFSFSLYSGQMCTAPQNVFVPTGGISTDQGDLSFAEVGERLAGALSRFTGDDAKAVEILGATVNDDVRSRATDVPALAERLGGEVLLDSRAITHPHYPDAVVRTPALIAVDAGNEAAYTQECFGPVAFVIRTESTPAVAGPLPAHRARARRHDGSGLLQRRGRARTDPRGRRRRRCRSVGEPDRADLRQPDRGVQRLPRHRGQPGRQLRLHRRGVRVRPLPGHHQPPARLRACGRLTRWRSGRSRRPDPGSAC